LGLGSSDSAPVLPTTIVSMNGLSSSCVLDYTTALTATLQVVRRMVTGGLVRPVLSPTDVSWPQVPATSMPRVPIGADLALLGAE